MDPEVGKVLGTGLKLAGALAAFGGMWLLGTSIVAAVILIVVGLVVLWLGGMIRDVSDEVSYERDVLD